MSKLLFLLPLFVTSCSAITASSQNRLQQTKVFDSTIKDIIKNFNEQARDLLNQQINQPVENTFETKKFGRLPDLSQNTIFKLKCMVIITHLFGK